MRWPGWRIAAGCGASGPREDGRGTVAVLTDAGWDVLVRTAPGHVGAVREHLFDRLDPEQVEQLGAICAAVLDGLDPDRTRRRTAPES